MTDLIELLKKPKQWVNECQQHLTELGYTELYNYDRFISEELGELIGNLKSGKTPTNRALLVDDIVNSMWVLLARSNFICIPLFIEDGDLSNLIDILCILHDEQDKIAVLISIANKFNINWQTALAALIAEKYSKLDFPIERRAEVFRDMKIQKRDHYGNYSECDKTLNNWDSTKILDYNPDEEIVLAVGYEVEFHRYGKHIIDRFDFIDKKIIYRDGGIDTFCSFKENDYEIKSVNGRRGKFVIPPFDFEKTLLDAGFQSDEHCIWSGSCFSPFIWVVKSNINLNGRHKIKPTPQTARILIEFKNKFEELEK